MRLSVDCTDPSFQTAGTSLPVWMAARKRFWVAKSVTPQLLLQASFTSLYAPYTKAPQAWGLSRWDLAAQT